MLRGETPSQHVAQGEIVARAALGHATCGATGDQPFQLVHRNRESSRENARARQGTRRVNFDPTGNLEKVENRFGQQKTRSKCERIFATKTFLFYNSEFVQVDREGAESTGSALGSKKTANVEDGSFERKRRQH